MIKINLLPWREDQRKARQKAFISALALSCGCTLLLVACIHVFITHRQNYQQQRNQILQNEINLLDQKITDIKTIEDKKTRLINKVELIYTLQHSRPEIVHVFNDIPHITPDGVFMTKLTRIGRQFIFEGKSQSNALISVLMSAIETSDWMQTPHLEIIQNQDKLTYDRAIGGEPLNDFVLRTQQTDLPIIK